MQVEAQTVTAEHTQSRSICVPKALPRPSYDRITNGPEALQIWGPTTS